MAKYHVKSDGSYGVCTAAAGNCPYSAEDENTVHVGTKKEALKIAEIWCENYNMNRKIVSLSKRNQSLSKILECLKN